jgi:hypothetical protein
MNRLILLLSILVTSNLRAESWSVGAKSLEIARCPKQYCLISSPCLSDQKSECQALKAMKNKVKAKSGPGGTNPGSAVCSQNLKGKVFIARDEKKNQTAFCQFTDGSFISLDGLWYW